MIKLGKFKAIAETRPNRRTRTKAKLVRSRQRKTINQLTSEFRKHLYSIVPRKEGINFEVIPARTALVLQMESKDDG